MKALTVVLAGAAMMCSSLVAAQTVEFGYPAFDQVSFSFFGGGARAMGMGYAFVGLADDVSSGLWNPAGLWVLEKPMMAASYNLYKPAGTFTSSLSTGSIENDVDLQGIGHFSFVAPVRIKGHPFVFNFNYDRSNEYSSKYGYRQVSGDIGYETGIEDKGFSRNYNFGASTRIYRQMSVGLLFNVIDGRRIVDQQGVYVRDSVIDPVYNISVQKITNSRMLDSTTSNGFNVVAGVMYKAAKFSVGATVRTPFTMKHSSDVGTFIVTTENGLPSIIGTDTVYVTNVLTKQDIPIIAALGAGVYPMENLRVTMDLNFQNYGSTSWYYQTGYSISASGVRTDYYTEVPIDWNNIFGIGGGVEYMLKTGVGSVPLRAGARYEQLPKPKSFVVNATDVGYDTAGVPVQLDYVVINRVASERQKEISLSLGTGIHWSKIELDVAYRYTTGGEVAVRDIATYYDATDVDDPVKQTVSDSKWEDKRHELRFTFTGYF